MFVFYEIQIIEAWMLKVMAGATHNKAHHLERGNVALFFKIAALCEVIHCLKLKVLLKTFHLLMLGPFHGYDCDKSHCCSLKRFW